ncbi:MAG: ribosome-associated translation inhibitor RaiA [Clostridia bacterium]|nr:ribosome-associated translation inhibitor RaiA [Clostridia bacterium]
MKLEIIARNYKLTDRLEDIINKKMEKFSRYFEDDAVAKIFLKETGGKNKYSMEVTIFFGSNMVRSEVSSDNMFNNIDIALPKIEGQIRKYRTKLSKLKKNALDEVSMYPQTEEKTPQVIRTKSMALKKIDIDEAVEDMELIDHDFHIFLNNKTGKVNVLYKRRAGNLGCIELDY